MPLKPFARPRQSMPASTSASGSPSTVDSTASPVTFSPSSPAKSSSVRAVRASGNGTLPGTPTPLHGKSSLSRTTTFGDVNDAEDVEQEERGDTPLRKRLPRATIHGTPLYTSSAGTQTTPTRQHTPTRVQTPVNPHFGSLSTPTHMTRSGSRSRLSVVAGPGSPYYSPDSPSQISRSTIIPFDVDASRRAAREDTARRESMIGDAAADDGDGVVSVRVQHGQALGQEEPMTPMRKDKGRLASLIGMVSTPLGKGKGTPVKRRGVVRKRSIWDRYVAIRFSSRPKHKKKPAHPLLMHPRSGISDNRISHLPTEIADEYLPDTYALPTHTALPLALFLHTIHFLVRAPLFLEPAARDRALSTAHTATGVGGAKRSWWSGRQEQEWDDVFKTPAEIAKGNLGRFERLHPGGVLRRGIVSGSAVSICCVFGDSRPEKREERAPGRLLFALMLVGNAWRYDMRYRTSPVDSPHARTAVKPEVVGEEQEKATTWKTTLRAGVQFINGQHLESRDSTSPRSGIAGRKRGDTMQVLNIWDPSDFAVVFFSYFSPLHIIIAQLFYPDHPLLTPLILAIITAHLTFLISQYQWLVKDRMTLNAEVMREYDQGFVYKKLFATRMDKSVQTNEAEMLY
ncbi:hypothetical protein QFC21_004159 [Naganishia friedmannii]|uniref:Uncharacterized protein n=1 Tax=Naganishia friedmannii TaxID=89922 RepID=A0ACC2VIR4_9TREE|nr:hypothetical protein QFC21_004159 [Naganishia friedmannii]